MFEWPSLLPDFLATVVGVALGIPVGLWLNRRASEHDRQREEEQARQRKLSVLKALLEEVGHNLELLKQIEGQLKGKGTPFYSLDTDMWPSLGSEVARAVTSEKALALVSRLYYEFDHMKRKLDAVFHIYANPANAGAALATQLSADLSSSILAQLPDTKDRCKEVLDILGGEVEQVAEDLNARGWRGSRVDDAAQAIGRERFATSAVGCFLAAFLFLQARVIGTEGISTTLLSVYTVLAAFFMLVAALLLFIALTDRWTTSGQRVERTLWLGIGYTTIAGLISGWGAGIAAISPCPLWRQWFFWLGFVWIMFYCVYFIRAAGARGPTSWNRQ